MISPGSSVITAENERHEPGHGEDQVTGGRPLANRAVHQTFDVERGRIKPNGNRGANRREGVEALRSGVPLRCTA
jgi:hypothetical protein